LKAGYWPFHQALYSGPSSADPLESIVGLQSLLHSSSFLLNC
jgi:hypothetical protein